MRAHFLIIVAALACAAPSFAQPLPDSVASAGLTRAQADELNRRLSTLQGRFNTLARETDLRAASVRNIAVEIFGAQPDLDFETYAGLIDSGARELQTYITQARARVENDPALAALRARAIAAAEDGRLTEARTLYDELIAAARTLRAATRRAEDLADSADLAEAARLSYVLADYRDAARRYGEAAAAAPDGTRERWQYYTRQAESLREYGGAFGDNAARTESVRILRDVALPLAPRDRMPEDWATTQMELGHALFLMGYYTGANELNASIAAYQSALTAIEPNTDNWARANNGLGNAYTALGRHGDRSQLQNALSAYRNALLVRTREADPVAWAAAQVGLGVAFEVLGDADSLRQGEQALNAAVEVSTRETSPTEWARVQSNLGDVYHSMGQLGDNAAYYRAVEAFTNAQEIFTLQSTPNYWGRMQLVIGNAYLSLAQRGDATALPRAIETYQAYLAARDRAGGAAEEARANYGIAQAYTAAYRQGDSAAAPRAAQAFEAALQFYTRETQPVMWAQTQTFLGLALRRMAEDGDRAALSRAITALTAALQVRTREALPSDWAANQYSLGLAHRLYVVQFGDRNHLQPALIALRAAAEEYERQGNTYWPGMARQWITELEAR